jgi:hypothetical protein
MAGSKKPSDRAARRASERAAEKLSVAREKLARLEPGGSVDNPIEVPSASVIEPRASAMPCPRCEGERKVVEHTAATAGERRVRVVRVRCVRCGAVREVYFRVGTALPS